MGNIIIPVRVQEEIDKDIKKADDEHRNRKEEDRSFFSLASDIVMEEGEKFNIFIIQYEWLRDNEGYAPIIDYSHPYAMVYSPCQYPARYSLAAYLKNGNTFKGLVSDEALERMEAALSKKVIVEHYPLSEEEKKKYRRNFHLKIWLGIPAFIYFLFYFPFHH